MSANHDLERRLADFYATEDPSRAPDWVLEAALAKINTTPQRRALVRMPWRFQNMNTFAKVAVAAMAVIVVGAVGIAVLRPGQTPGVGGGQVSPGLPSSAPPSASPSPSPFPSVSPALTETFTSTMHGISVSYPGGWNVRPATEIWTTGLPFQGSPFADVMESGNTFILVASQPLAGKTADRWAADVSTHADWGDSCVPSTEQISIDGTPGLLVVRCPDDGVHSAVVWAGDRGYLMVGYGLPSLDYFKAVLATVQLDPADALDAAPSSSP